MPDSGFISPPTLFGPPEEVNLLHRFDLLIRAAMPVLETHGLPASCEAMEQPWQFEGNEEQRAALMQLYQTIDHILPPLPDQKGGT